MTDEQGRPDVGTLADEVAKLADALRGSFADWGAHGIADGSAACRVCPLCQLIALVRQISPETVDEVSEQVRDLLQTLRTLVDAAAGHGTGGRDERVEKIRLGDDGGEDIPWE
ncbi:MAG: hypothetical protein GEU96_15590 [Propionibacteriales bacterium]|nr:hypothetical protein [Propionibacteriales bacterium]